MNASKREMDTAFEIEVERHSLASIHRVVKGTTSETENKRMHNLIKTDESLL